MTARPMPGQQNQLSVIDGVREYLSYVGFHNADMVSAVVQASEPLPVVQDSAVVAAAATAGSSSTTDTLSENISGMIPFVTEYSSPVLMHAIKLLIIEYHFAS